MDKIINLLSKCNCLFKSTCCQSIEDTTIDEVNKSHIVKQNICLNCFTKIGKNSNTNSEANTPT